jgi:hypothetical protein
MLFATEKVIVYRSKGEEMLDTLIWDKDFVFVFLGVFLLLTVILIVGSILVNTKRK